MRLLHHMSQFMSQQTAAAIRGWRIQTSTEGDAIAGCVGDGIHCIRRTVRIVIGVHADMTEIVLEAGFEECPGRVVKRLPRGGQHAMHNWGSPYKWTSRLVSRNRSTSGLEHRVSCRGRIGQPQYVIGYGVGFAFERMIGFVPRELCLYGRRRRCDRIVIWVDAYGVETPVVALVLGELPRPRRRFRVAARSPQ
jgi:hypothetical protein